MSVFYLNDCGDIKTGDHIKEIGKNLTIIIMWSIRTQNNMTFKIIDNYTGTVVATKEANEPFDPYTFKKSNHPFNEHDINYVINEIEQQSPAYREVMHKLFLQKLEEYIKEQWKTNSTR